MVATRVEAAAMAAKAGVNLNCGYIYQYLPKAVDSGLITEKIVNAALEPLLRTRFNLGLFDPDEINPYSRSQKKLSTAKSISNWLMRLLLNQSYY